MDEPCLGRDFCLQQEPAHWARVTALKSALKTAGAKLPSAEQGTRQPCPGYRPEGGHGLGCDGYEASMTWCCWEVTSKQGSCYSLLVAPSGKIQRSLWQSGSCLP